jgi:hypothetical protein
VQHLGSHHYCYLEHCSGSSVVHLWGVVGAPEELPDAKFVVHAAPSSFLDCQSFQAGGVDLDAAAFGAGWGYAT